VGRVVDEPDDKRVEQALDLVAGERYQLVRPGMAGVFVGADDSEESMGEHRESYPAVPGRPASDLVFVQSGEALAGLEGLLNRPSASGDLHQGGQRYVGGRIAAVEGEFTGAPVAAHEQLVVAGPVVGDVGQGPVVKAVEKSRDRQTPPWPDRAGR